MELTRRGFIAASSLLATGFPAVASADSSLTIKPSTAPKGLTFDFDQKAFDSILLKPARHKQCFGAVRLDGGGVIASMANSIIAYDDFLREGNGAMQAVGVLYHSSAITLAMSNEVWNEILVPYLRQNDAWRKDIPEAKPGKGNPYLKPIWVPGLVNIRGGSLLVCHNAIEDFAYGAADALKESPQRVHAAIMAGIVPGALVVPSGVMAINACQEKRFTYIQSSV
ncbi:MAG: hypothetical protein ACYDDQ_02015 [Vulcanimicrobiaceae bacterium]